MKKIILILCLLFSLFGLYANDTYFFMAGGQLVPTKEGNVDVETSYTDYPLKKNWSSNEPTELENAYVRTIKFPSKKTTKTRISYKATYGREAPSYNIAKYLYGTGSSWKNSIGKMTVRIQSNLIYDSPIHLSLPKENLMKRVSDNVWEAVYTNIEPESYTDCITIILGDIFGDTGPRVLQKNRFVPCNVKLTKQSLFWYTKSQLRLLRNAIYAFNGYPFKSKDLIELFEVKCAEYGWFGFKKIDGDYKGYYPLDKNFSEDKLSDIEKYNVKLILEEEKSR